MTTKYIAFFDLDHTILTTSSGRLFIKYAFDNNLLNRMDMVKGFSIGLIHRLGFIDTEGMIKRWAKKYKGEPEQETIDISKKWFNEIVVNYFRDSVFREINYHKENSGRIVILSAATKYVCDEVKEYLKLDDVICTKLKIENGKFTGDLVGRYCYGKEKQIKALEYCSNNGYSLKDSFYYGDSCADRYILESVDHPVCVEPDWRLKKLANRMNWKIIGN